MLIARNQPVLLYVPYAIMDIVSTILAATVRLSLSYKGLACGASTYYPEIARCTLALSGSSVVSTGPVGC